MKGGEKEKPGKKKKVKTAREGNPRILEINSQDPSTFEREASSWKGGEFKKRGGGRKNERNEELIISWYMIRIKRGKKEK